MDGRTTCRAVSRVRSWLNGMLIRVRVQCYTARDKRSAFQRMLADTETGAFDAVIVHKLDRFSCNLWVTRARTCAVVAINHYQNRVLQA